jgi:hypothetical protein
LQKPFSFFTQRFSLFLPHLLLTPNSFITFTTNLRAAKLQHDVNGLDPAVSPHADDATLLAAVLPPTPDEPASLQWIQWGFRIPPGVNVIKRFFYVTHAAANCVCEKDS